jgi:hypothetical protein
MNKVAQYLCRDAACCVPTTIRQLTLFLFLALLASAACGQAGSPTTVPTDVHIELDVEPAPPATGDSTLILTLTDANGIPVSGATINVEGNMDHAGMEPATGQTSDDSDGVYHVPFRWTMGGGWIVTVTATLPSGGVAIDTFEMFVEAASSGSVIHQTEESGGG